MVLSSALGIVLGDWEEKLTAAAFLSGRKFPAAAFEPAVLDAVTEALNRLDEVPLEWARALCQEALVSRSCQLVEGLHGL